MSEACEESACQVSQGRGMAVLLREPKEEAGGCGLGPWTRQTVEWPREVTDGWGHLPLSSFLWQMTLVVSKRGQICL